MIRGIIFGAAVAALMMGSIASAQETGSLITRKVAQIDSRDKDAARKTLEAFSTCVVERQYGRAAKLINIPIDSAEYKKQMGGLTTYYDDCLSTGEFSLSFDLMRGGLFQAFYLREFKLKGPVSFDPQTVTGYRAMYPETLSDQARSSVALINFAECVTRADGANVRLLMTMPAGSKGETGVFQSLAPKFGPCIVQGNQIKFSKAILKGALAEGLYRLSVASKAGEGVK
jgi:hypothetical protein